MKSKTAKNIHLILLGFLGLSAFGGGATLIISPSGKLLGGLPLSLLENSPFDNFLIPGIILFLVLGVFPLFIVFALIKKPVSIFAERFNLFSDMHWAWTFSIYIAFALIIWIQVEIIYIQGVGWLQTFYMLFSIPMIIFALIPQTRNIYKKNENRL